MAELLLKTNLPRERGYLYFVKNDPCEIWKAKMGRGKKKEEVKEEEEFDAAGRIIK